jgi:tetratricopeptide (TPR) repeat protein
MGHHESNGDSTPFVQIQPADLTLSSSSGAADKAQKEEKSGKTFWLGILIGGLAGLAVLVILLLPDHIKKPAAPALVTDQSPGSQAAPPAGPEISPWQEAQSGKQRAAAQDILEKLLDRQFQLEEIGVAQWAGEDFAGAMALANEGDEYYRSRQFEEALTSYGAGLELMEQLLARKEQALSDSMSAGNAAIEQGDAAAAKDAFDLTLTIDPDNPDALQGLQRTKVLDKVRQLLANARQLEESGSTIEALATLQQVAGLDPARGTVGQSIVRLQALLNQQAFKRQMSAGYQAMGRENYSAAIAAFQAAIKLDPKAGEAREALKQAQGDKNLVAISGHLEKAKEFRQQEEWRKALREYDLALKIDANLQVVLQSRKETDIRAKLDAALQDAIARPERLNSEAVWRAAQVINRSARAIENPGPRLQRQITTLQEQLQYAITPIMVTFSSDNLSEINLHKVARLGSFTSRQLELKPGDYVIVASREGYRDVRKEFTVEPRSQSMQMTIQCEEQI